MTYNIIIAPAAARMLKSISDRRVRELLIKRIDQLSEEPEQQGKPLIEELAGYRSVRAAGQRYRIIYRVVNDAITVFVVAAGIRREGSGKDIYHLARKLIRLRLLEPER